ncbi:hypothetical protein PENTCL1PPCAC_14565, partial [Pristionchus entomophagus]
QVHSNLSMLPLLSVLLLASAAHAALHQGDAEPVLRASRQVIQGNAGPVLRSGRYRVLQEKILKPEETVMLRESPSEAEVPFLQEESQAIPSNGQRYSYDGPLEGRRIHLYRRTHTPVQYENGQVVQKSGPRQTVERWAEGGYKEAQGQFVNVHYRVGNHIYVDEIVPIKEGNFNGLTSSF